MNEQQTSGFWRPFKTFEFSCKYTKEQLTIEGKLRNKELMFGTLIKANKLPSSCLNIFDNIKELFDFLKDQSEENINIEGNSMQLKVSIFGDKKFRLVEIPFRSAPFGKEQKLEQEIDKMKERMQRLESNMKQLLKMIPEEVAKSVLKQGIYQKIKHLDFRLKKIEEKPEQQLKKSAIREDSRSQVIEPAQQTTAKKESQKFSSPIQKLNSERYKNQRDSNVGISTFAEYYKKNPGLLRPLVQPSGSSSPAAFPKELKSNPSTSSVKDPRVHEFHFQIDQDNQFLDKFLISSSVITKKTEDGRLYQIYSQNHIPDRYRCNIKFKFGKVSPDSLCFGLITERIKQFQYVFRNEGTISMGGDKGYELYVNGQPEQIMLNGIRSGTVMEIEVQLKTKKVRFYKNGDRRNPLAKFTLPQNMSKEKIYPFFQFRNQNDCVELI